MNGPVGAGDHRPQPGDRRDVDPGLHHRESARVCTRNSRVLGGEVEGAAEGGEGHRHAGGAGAK